ncbi:MAG: hypothetical protein LBK50_01650 [Candidatus Nomurabacteria bacterium]|jgi:hypothetical protein|nr:hypothetical protein [Candidatus Nomurabacteria bacterium]
MENENLEKATVNHAERKVDMGGAAAKKAVLVDDETVTKLRRYEIPDDKKVPYEEIANTLKHIRKDINDMPEDIKDIFVKNGLGVIEDGKIIYTDAGEQKLVQYMFDDKNDELSLAGFLQDAGVIRISDNNYVTESID